MVINRFGPLRNGYHIIGLWAISLCHIWNGFQLLLLTVIELDRME